MTWRAWKRPYPEDLLPALTLGAPSCNIDTRDMIQSILIAQEHGGERGGYGDRGEEQGGSTGGIGGVNTGAAAERVRRQAAQRVVGTLRPSTFQLIVSTCCGIHWAAHAPHHMPLNTCYSPRATHSPRATLQQTRVTLSRQVDECKPLVHGGLDRHRSRVSRRADQASR